MWDQPRAAPLPSARPILKSVFTGIDTLQLLPCPFRNGHYLAMAGNISSSQSTLSAYDCKSADKLAWEPLIHTCF